MLLTGQMLLPRKPQRDNSFLGNKKNAMSKERHVSELAAHLGYWLRFVSNHVSQAFARKVEARGVTVAEWVLLRQLLDEEALAPSRLSERMGMTRGTVSK